MQSADLGVLLVVHHWKVHRARDMVLGVLTRATGVNHQVVPVLERGAQ
jgi:hypothetical protein